MTSAGQFPNDTQAQEEPAQENIWKAMMAKIHQVSALFLVSAHKLDFQSVFSSALSK